MHPIDCELAAMDGTGHTSDYADPQRCIIQHLQSITGILKDGFYKVQY